VSDGGEHAALVYGSPGVARAALVRVHSECFTGDIFGSLRCDCGSQLDAAMRAIVEAGSGIVVYLRQEGRGIGLLNKIRAYALQEQGLDTVEANQALGLAPDARDYRVGADMLRDLGVTRVRLMSNNPEKIRGLERWGIDVVERVPLVLQPMHDNFRYMETKAVKMGHLYHVHDLGVITAIKAGAVS
jgi:3,4-dihydroxy 2-butanone 4-phosphate synthase/GTP cyclohydrolase II